MHHLSPTPTRVGFIRKSCVYALIAGMMLPVNFTAHAANNALSAVADANTIDYVVNVDWDYDNPPTQVGNPEQVLDRAFITNIIRTTAQSVFTYTEGRHRLGTIFIYKNKLFNTNVDIQIINKDGRSNAHVSGWGKPVGWTSHNYLTLGSPETADQVGKVIAHELGHYTYGLLDEYAEAAGSSSPRIPSFPQPGDTPKDTMMKNHLQFLSLSLPSDYTDPNLRVTAQARVMGTGTNGAGFSAWETLTRSPDADPPEGRRFNRTFFEAFRGIDASKLQLTRPVQGFDAKLNLLFASNPVFRDVILIDRTLSAARLAALVQAGKALIAEAKPDTQFAVVVSPPVGNGPIAGYTPGTAQGKAALTAALDALSPATTGAFDGLAAFTQAFNLLAAARKAGDPATFHLLGGPETSLPAEAGTSARTARVAVNPMSIGDAIAEPAQLSQRRVLAQTRALAQSASGGVINLAQLAKQTGGVYSPGKNAADVAKNAVRGMKETHAQLYAALSFDESGPMASGKQFNSQFSVASGATDGSVFTEMFFNPADAAKLQFSLIAPNGTVYTPRAMPASGLQFRLDAAKGIAEFTIDPDFAGRVGQWTARAQASGAVNDGVVLEVSSDASVSLGGSVDGGNVGAVLGPVLRATLGGEARINRALVTANIYSEEGKLVLANVALLDDGIGSDSVANDGQYAVDLSGKLPAGSFYAVINAKTTAASRTAAQGAQIQGALFAEVPVEGLVRVEAVSFALESGATGVTAATTTASTTTATATFAGIGNSGSAGGGCTVGADGKDAGLLLLLLTALAGCLLRRRRHD